MIFDEKFSPTERLLIGAFTVLMAAGGFAAGRIAFSPSGAVVQPIQFNHQKHVKKAGLECSICHQYFADHRTRACPISRVCTGLSPAAADEIARGTEARSRWPPSRRRPRSGNCSASRTTRTTRIAAT